MRTLVFVLIAKSTAHGLMMRKKKMSDYDNTNSGALFKNDKEGNENRPDYKGQINVNGVEFWISSWLKVSKKGQKYMSLSVQPKDEVHRQGMQRTNDAMNYPQQQAPQQTQQQAEQFDDFDDDIPF